MSNNNTASQNSKRIAKNTVILYMRMIVTTVISLYTSRIILQLLGLTDFGIHNVVGGLIEFAAIFTGTMTSATQRFLSFELGRNDIIAFKKTFCSLYNIFIIFSILLFIISLPIGLWMVYHVLDISPDRLYAATYVLACAILSFELNTLATPYMSAIIAFEKMDVYTYISIAEAVFKLLATVFLFVYDGDKLIAFAIITLIFRALLNVIIVQYCKKNLEGCTYYYIWDKMYLKRLASYSGWTLIGSTSYALMTQGHSILLNIFFGPIINAAKGIADRVKNFDLLFSQNIFVAITPQLTKSYAAGDFQYSRTITMASTRLSFLLLLLVSFPLMMEMRPMLELWLGAENVTSETVSFSFYSIIFVLITTQEAPLTKVVQASGNVKSYEIIVGMATLLFIPISYFLLKLGYNATSTYITMNALYVTILIYRLYRVKRIIDFSFGTYFSKTIIPIFVVCLFIGISAFLSEKTFLEYALFYRLSIWFVIVSIAIIFFGLSKDEKKICLNFIQKKLSRNR